MTPKEKAQELVWKYYNILEHTISDEYSKKDWDIAKQCALIAVDLLISETFLDFYVNHPQPFWQEVKTELEKL